MTEEHHRSIALGLLSFAAGAADATAFLSLGDVFTSAMSGNTVLLGLAIGQGRLAGALHALAAFAGYACGVALAVLPLRNTAQGVEQTIGLEAAFLAAFVAVWLLAGGPAGPTQVYVLIVLSAVAMGLQGGVGRAMQVPGVSTIVFTSTVTAMIDAVAKRVLRGDRRAVTVTTRHQLASYLAYFTGAVLAGCSMSTLPRLLPFLPLAAVLTLAAGLKLGFIRRYLCHCQSVSAAVKL